MEEISPGDRSAELRKAFETEPWAPSILGHQRNVESYSRASCRFMEKKYLPRIDLEYPLYLTR